MFRKLSIAVLMSIVVTAAFGQEGTGAAITGTVTDSQHASILGATVTITDVATGVVTKTTTNNRGLYRTPLLQTGTYTVDIESKGFKQYKESNIILDIGATAEINAVLTPGEVVDTVTVEANTEVLLEKTDSTVGTVFTTQLIEDLPLNVGGTGGRDYLQLATLTPGVSAGSSSGGVSIGGQASQQSAFLLDGLDNNNQEILTSHSGQKEIVKPSVDAISELKIVTTSYSAEYGRSSSGVVSVNTKSGTNKINGSAFEFIRNDAVDARPYNTASAKLPYKYNDFGGTLGGPIRKDRTFIFGDVEFLRYRAESESYSLVPTDEERSGQFDDTYTPPTSNPTAPDPNGIYLPTSYKASTKQRTTTFPVAPAFSYGTYNPPSGTKTYQIPATSQNGTYAQGAYLDTVASTMLQYWPEPNLNCAAQSTYSACATLPKYAPNPANQNYFFDSNGGTNNYRWDLRVDETLSAKQTLFGRFSSQQSRGLLSYSLPPVNGQYFAGSGINYNNSQAFALGYNNALTPNLLFSARAGWNKIYWKQGFPTESLTGVGIPGVPTTNPGFSSISASGYAGLGLTNNPNSDDSQDRELAADITWNRGAHTLKFGWQEYFLQTNFNSSQITTGTFSTTGYFTELAPANTPGVTQKFADFLLGDLSAETFSDPSILNFRSPYSHFFVQDYWKVTHSLTLNLGLRYELSPPAVSKFNTIANFDMDSNPSSPQLIKAGQFGGKRDQRALQNVSYTNLAPRFGFAYSPENSKTVIRGGYGIFYSNAITIGGMQSMENNPVPGVNGLRLSNTVAKTLPQYYLDKGFPTGALALDPTDYAASGSQNVTLVSFDKHAVIPTDQQWNLNIQRALPYGILAEVGYSGNKFDHNWWQIDANPGIPALAKALGLTVATPATRPFPTTTIPGEGTVINLTTISRVYKEGWSHYNAFQVKAEKRYAKGLTFLANYSYSKTLGIGEADPQNLYDIPAERAATSISEKHHFVVSGAYPLPFGRGQQFGGNWNRWVDGALGGWSFSPIFTYSAGLPLTLSASGNNSTTGDTDRPNLVGNPFQGGAVAGNPGCNAPAVVHTRAAWFNPCVFQVNPAYTFGNVGRGSIFAPSSYDWDASIHKTIAITERVKSQLRLEAFNVTNHASYGSPGLSVLAQQSSGVLSTSSTLGQITSSSNTARQVQAALKILF
jgi:hypothetical protein